MDFEQACLGSGKCGGDWAGDVELAVIRIMFCPFCLFEAWERS